MYTLDAKKVASVMRAFAPMDRIATESGLPALKNVMITPLSKGIAFHMTDRYRLGIEYVPYLVEPHHKVDKNAMLVDRTNLARALTFRTKECEVFMYDTGSTVTLNVGGVDVTLKKVDKEAVNYPNVLRLVPEERQWDAAFTGSFLAESVHQPGRERSTVYLGLDKENPNKPAAVSDGETFYNLVVPVRTEASARKGEAGVRPAWLDELITYHKEH